MRVVPRREADSFCQRVFACPLWQALCWRLGGPWWAGADVFSPLWFPEKCCPLPRELRGSGRRDMLLVAVLFSMKFRHSRIWCIFVIPNSHLWLVEFLYWLQELRWREHNAGIPFCRSFSPSSNPNPEQRWMRSNIKWQGTCGNGVGANVEERVTIFWLSVLHHPWVRSFTNRLLDLQGDRWCGLHLIGSRNREVK